MKGWNEHYKTKPLVSSSIDYYKIEFYYRVTLQVTPQATQQVTQQAERFEEIRDFCLEPKTREEIQSFLKIKNREYFRSEILIL